MRTIKKSEIAESAYKIINLYRDFIDSGFIKNTNHPDFSGFDTVPEKAVEINENYITKKPVADDEDLLKKRKLVELASGILKCDKCGICSKHKIPGAGNSSADIFVISYFPTYEEEKEGRPFAGEAGNFFRKWMESIKLDYDSLFLSHLIKCNPGNNAITKESIEICKKHMDEQVEVIKPSVILVLGEVVLSSLCRKFMPIVNNHGKKFTYNGIPFFATYHPLDVLKNPALKKPVWDDLKAFSAFIKGNHGDV